MDEHSLRFHHRCSPDLGKSAKILGDVSVQKILQFSNGWGCRTFQKCIPHPCHTYMRCLSTFNCLGMGIWMNTHSVTTTDVSQGLKKLAKMLGDASVQTMQFSNGWGCRTSQTASHIHVIQIWGVDHRQLLRMGIWMHIHSVITTDVPQVWESWLKS
jgi:hypothetical protein